MVLVEKARAVLIEVAAVVVSRLPGMLQLVVVIAVV